MKNRILLFCWAVSSLLLPVPSALAANETEIVLPAGGQHVMKLAQPLRRVAIGSEEIAEAKVLGNQELLLQGNKPGATSLLIWLKGERTAKNFRLLVNKGIASSARAELGEIALRSSGNLSMISGPASDMVQHDAARKLATQSAGTDGKAVPLLDATALPYSGEVQIDVKVVEFSRKVLHKAGLNLLSNKSGFTFGAFGPGSMSKATLNSAQGGGSISVDANIPITQALNLVIGSGSNNILGVLSALEGNGFARTLAQPTLVAQSGRSADFLAGGEFPVPVPQALGQTTIQYKPFGIRLEVSPTVLAENRIALTLTPEVSELNFEDAITINGVTVPSMTTRRASTSIELGNGESFVIGGLVSQSITKNINKIPGLGDIPVLGAFFKNINLSREEKELVFIVTPKLVRPLAAGTDLGAMPGDERAKANMNSGLWRTLFLSDDDENQGYTGFSK